MKHILLKLEDEDHRRIKLGAFEDGKTMKQFILDKVFGECTVVLRNGEVVSMDDYCGKIEEAPKCEHEVEPMMTNEDKKKTYGITKEQQVGKKPKK